MTQATPEPTPPVRVEFNFRLSFGLSDRDEDRFEEVGLRFHRWLPDGQQDALLLPAAPPIEDLRVWLARERVDNGSLRGPLLNPDSAEIRRYGMLEAGPLFGDFSVVLSPLEREALDAKPEVENETLVDLAKRIVDSIQEPLGRLTSVLRIQYGHHWIEPFERFDSRYQSLGSFARSLSLTWAEPGGERKLFERLRSGRWSRRKGRFSLRTSTI